MLPSPVTSERRITVTSHTAVQPPNSAVAVIVTAPTAFAVTTPSSTVATSVFDEVHVTVGFAVSDGKTFAVSVSVSPTARVAMSLSRVRDSAGTVL